MILSQRLQAALAHQTGQEALVIMTNRCNKLYKSVNKTMHSLRPKTWWVWAKKTSNSTRQSCSHSSKTTEASTKLLKNHWIQSREREKKTCLAVSKTSATLVTSIRFCRFTTIYRRLCRLSSTTRMTISLFNLWRYNMQIMGKMRQIITTLIQTSINSSCALKPAEL